jgi:hypothetical protein
MTALQDQHDEITANPARLLNAFHVFQVSNSSSWVPVRSRCTVLAVVE